MKLTSTLFKIIIVILVVHFLSFDLVFAMSSKAPESPLCSMKQLKLSLQTPAQKWNAKLKKLENLSTLEPLSDSLSWDQLNSSGTLLIQAPGTKQITIKVINLKQQSLESKILDLNQSGAGQILLDNFSQLKASEPRILIISRSNCTTKLVTHVAD